MEWSGTISKYHRHLAPGSGKAVRQGDHDPLRAAARKRRHKNTDMFRRTRRWVFDFTQR